MIKELLAKARQEASLSRKSNTKVGALLLDSNNEIILRSCNDYVYPVYDNIKLESNKTRSFYSEHAERRLIYSAFRFGINDFSDKTLVITHFPCCECARAIILVGLKNIIVGFDQNNKKFYDKWESNLIVSRRMLTLNNINIIYE